MADFSVNSDKYHKQVKSLEPTDRSHASVFNERFQQLFDNTNFLHEGKAEKNGGDISEMIVESLETSDEKFPIPAAKESCKTFFGKSKKFFEDFKNWQAGVCLVGQIVNNCVTDRGDLPGSAAQLKVLKDLYTQLNSDLLNRTYPIGSIYLSVSASNPNSLFGGTWERIHDRFLLGAGSAYALGSMGGSNAHDHLMTLRMGASYSVGIMPHNQHPESGIYNYRNNSYSSWSRDGNITQEHPSGLDYSVLADGQPVFSTSGYTQRSDNLPPYLAVCIWKRIA